MPMCHEDKWTNWRWQLSNRINTAEEFEKVIPLTPSERKALSNGAIYVVPSGALPSYVLDDLRYNATDSVIVYVGKPDLVLGNGVRQEAWYSQLDSSQRSRVVLHDSAPDEFLDKNLSLFREVLENGWASRS